MPQFDKELGNMGSLNLVLSRYRFGPWVSQTLLSGRVAHDVRSRNMNSMAYCATESSEYCSKAMFNDTERDLKCGSAESVDIESSRIMRIGIPPFNL